MENEFKSIKTLKLKYKLVYSVGYEHGDLLDRLINQYNSLVHIYYNQLVDNPKYKYKDACDTFDKLNNVELIDSYLRNASYQDAKALYKRYNKGKRSKNPLGHKLIFGGKTLFKKRSKKLITKEEFIAKRLRPLMVIGEANKGGNGRFKIRSNRYIDYVIDGKVILTFRITDKRCRSIGKLKPFQDNEVIPLTYKISKHYIYLTFDSSVFEDKKHDVFSNRIMSLDLNPGYIGITILDIDLKTKELKTKYAFVIDWIEILNKHIKSKCSSVTDINKYYNNKRIHEIKEVNKLIYKLAIQFNCKYIVCEYLEFKHSKGRKMANLWNRSLTIKSLISRCDSNNIKLLFINPAYTSKVGNILCKHNIPDMCRSAEEIGYRAFRGIQDGKFTVKGYNKEVYYHGIKEIKNFVTKSLEERGDKVKIKSDTIPALNKIIDAKRIKYRVSIKECESNDTVSLYKSNKSMIKLHSYKIKQAS